MTWLPTLLCAALLAAPQDPPGDPTGDPQGGGPPAPFQALDFEAACARAADSGRVLVAALVQADCEDCLRLAETWSDASAARWLEVETVAIEVRATERGDLLERYAVATFPTVLLLEADGLELDRLEGFFPPGLFVKALTGALALREVLADLRPRLAENPDDPELHLALARAYASVDRLAPAVVAYETAWQVGRGVAPFERVRTGQMLNEVNSQAQKYLPARKALLRWRREALEALSDLTSPGAAGAAVELSAIYRVMQDQPAALELYERLRSRPDVPPAVLTATFDGQVATAYYNQKRFPELAEGLGDVFVRTVDLFAELDVWRQKEREGTVPPGEESTIRVLAGGLYSKTAMYLEVLLRVEQEEEARQLADLVLLREPYSQAYASLMRAARKGGSARLAREIADRGLAALQKRELARFQELVDGFFREREH